MKDLIRMLGDTDSYLSELAIHELTSMANESELFKRLITKELAIKIKEAEGLQKVLGLEDDNNHGFND
jgi:hypothetical protein